LDFYPTLIKLIPFETPFIPLSETV